MELIRAFTGGFSAGCGSGVGNRGLIQTFPQWSDFHLESSVRKPQVLHVIEDVGESLCQLSYL